MGWFKQTDTKAEPQLPALRVRLQHVDLDDAAIEGIWVGTYDGHYHLRAARTVMAGDMKPFRHDEVLVAREKVAFLEVLGRDQRPDPTYDEPGAAGA